MTRQIDRPGENQDDEASLVALDAALIIMIARLVAEVILKESRERQTEQENE